MHDHFAVKAYGPAGIWNICRARVFPCRLGIRRLRRTGDGTSLVRQGRMEWGMTDIQTGAGGTVHAGRLEIGWLLVNVSNPDHVTAVTTAADRFRTRMEAFLPGFSWDVSVVERHAGLAQGPVDPVLLLSEAETERDIQGWDFVFVITGQDLVSHMRPFTIAAPSRIFAAAVLSTARIADRTAGKEILGRRLLALAMHLFGRLNGLDPKSADGFMHAFGNVAALDAMDGFTENEIAELEDDLRAVSDPRVEEMADGQRNPLSFYARALWQNRHLLPESIARMRPWSFPVRLSRLSTAAGSAFAVLMMTAESWEVATSLAAFTVVLFSMFSLVATSAYLLKAQRLLARPGKARLSEQRVVSDVSTVIAVGIGMAVTYAVIFVLAWIAGFAFFRDPVLAKWLGAEILAGSPRNLMAGFTAALSLVIGALGASFEPYGYFRSVTHIDDEL